MGKEGREPDASSGALGHPGAQSWIPRAVWGTQSCCAGDGPGAPGPPACARVGGREKGEKGNHGKKEK